VPDSGQPSLASQSPHAAGNASSAMKDTWDGIRTETIDVWINAQDSMHFKCESDSNKIEESNLQNEKHFEVRFSTQRGITVDERDPKNRTNVVLKSLKRKNSSTEKVEFSDSSAIDEIFESQNAYLLRSVTE
jgi:hypothetical protein